MPVQSYKSYKSSTHVLCITVLLPLFSAEYHNTLMCFLSCGMYNTYFFFQGVQSVEDYPLTAFPGGLRRLYETGPDTVLWLSRLSISEIVRVFQTNNYNDGRFVCFPTVCGMGNKTNSQHFSVGTHLKSVNFYGWYSGIFV